MNLAITLKFSFSFCPNKVPVMLLDYEGAATIQYADVSKRFELKMYLKALMRFSHKSI